ncbi:unnamed protein product [Symbiodinium natans]|uniref:Uncharacterized protein n=1 Tax=Symbiodinium natans TaxID=878477 RepID=A0A812TG58_9DINO|nr:unnamed protein product [Symbiodinium natans]
MLRLGSRAGIVRAAGYSQAGGVAVADSELPVIIVDEANTASPTRNGNGENTAKREAAPNALQLLVALTKQDRKVGVIPVASTPFHWVCKTLASTSLTPSSRTWFRRSKMRPC